MCRFILATIPVETDLSTLEMAIPEQLRLSLLNVGVRDSWVEPHHIGYGSNPAQGMAIGPLIYRTR